MKLPFIITEQGLEFSFEKVACLKDWNGGARPVVHPEDWGFDSGRGHEILSDD